MGVELLCQLFLQCMDVRQDTVNSFTISKELRTTVCYGCQTGYINSFSVRKKLRTTVFYCCQKGCDSSLYSMDVRQDIVNSLTIRKELRTTVFYGCQKGYVIFFNCDEEATVRSTVFYGGQKGFVNSLYSMDVRKDFLTLFRKDIS